MKKCLPTEKSKDSLEVSASFQTRPLMALHSTTLSNPSRAGCHHSWLTGLTLMACMRITYEGLHQRMHRKSSLQIICTNGWSSY